MEGSVLLPARTTKDVHNEPIRNMCSRFPVRKSELDRFKFGKKRYNELRLFYGRFPFSLDVACGAKPFPKSNVLCDLNLSPVPDRNMKKLITDGKPFVLCDSCHLPFKDHAFDFATSYYLIEHIENPGNLYKELTRVSEHGYIQCPSWFNELLYGENVHKWIVYKRHGGLLLKPKSVLVGLIDFGFIFQRMYQSSAWKIIHAILDESFNLFSVQFEY
jgi:hypothetical protein